MSDAQRSTTVRQVPKFLVVGGIAFIVDLAVFNLIRFFIGEDLAAQTTPIMLTKIASAAVATLVSWLLNRSWTFSEHRTQKPVRELVMFAVVNVIGMLPPLICLWFSRSVLGLDSVFADNISGNFIGLALGTILRYFGYRFLVFRPAADQPTVDHPTAVQGAASQPDTDHS